MRQFVKEALVSIGNLYDVLTILKDYDVKVRICMYGDDIPEGISPTVWNAFYALQYYHITINCEHALTKYIAEDWMIILKLHDYIELEEGEGIGEKLKIFLATGWGFTTDHIRCIDSKCIPVSVISKWKTNCYPAGDLSIVDYLQVIAENECKKLLLRSTVWLKNGVSIVLVLGDEPGSSYWSVSEEAIPYPAWYIERQKPSTWLDADHIHDMKIEVYDQITNTFTTLTLKPGEAVTPFLQKLDEIALYIGAAFDESPMIIKDGEVVSLLKAYAKVWNPGSLKYQHRILSMSNPFDKVEWVSTDAPEC